jgi:hypothetical protein
MCLLLDMSNSIIVFYKMSVIYVPLFNFNVIVLVCDKRRRMLSSSNSYA